MSVEHHAPTARPSRRIGPIICALVFLLAGLNALVQVPGELPGLSDEPTILWAWQSVIGVCGVLAAYAGSTGRPWAWKPALGYAILASAMILSLGPILDLDADARESLPLGAGAVLAVTGALAWYLRRALTPRR